MWGISGAKDGIRSQDAVPATALTKFQQPPAGQLSFPPPRSHKSLHHVVMPGAALPRVTCRQVPGRLVTAQPARSTPRLYSSSHCGFTGGTGKLRVISAASGLRETEDPAEAHAKVQADLVTRPHKALQPLPLHLPALHRPRGGHARCFLGKRGMAGAGHSLGQHPPLPSCRLHTALPGLLLL